jgi:hypothetical protein
MCSGSQWVTGESGTAGLSTISAGFAGMISSRTAAEKIMRRVARARRTVTAPSGGPLGNPGVDVGAADVGRQHLSQLRRDDVLLDVTLVCGHRGGLETGASCVERGSRGRIRPASSCWARCRCQWHVKP